MQFDFIAEISSVSTRGSGVDLILDCVGASYWEKNLNCLSTDGRWIIYGLLSGGEVHGDLLARLLSKRASIHTSLLRSRDKEASSGYQQCMQFDFKIYDSLEGFLLKPALNTFLSKKRYYTLWKMSQNYDILFLFLSNSSLNERNDTQDFVMCFLSTII